MVAETVPEGSKRRRCVQMPGQSSVYGVYGEGGDGGERGKGGVGGNEYDYANPKRIWRNDTTLAETFRQANTGTKGS